MEEQVRQRVKRAGERALSPSSRSPAVEDGKPQRLQGFPHYSSHPIHYQPVEKHQKIPEEPFITDALMKELGLLPPEELHRPPPNAKAV